MSADNETTVVYRAILEGVAEVAAGLQKVNADLAVSANIDRELFAGGKISRDEFLADLKSIDAEAAKNSAALAALRAETEQAGPRMVSLGSAVGLTRRELSIAASEIGTLTGASSALTSGLGALAMGFGPVAVGTIGVVEVLKLMQSSYDNLYAPSKALNDELAKEATGAGDAAQQLANLAGVTDRMAAGALASTKNHAEEAAQIQTLSKAVENLRASKGFMADLAAGNADATRIWEEATGALDTAVVKLNSDVYSAGNAHNNLAVTFVEETQATYDASVAQTLYNDAMRNGGEDLQDYLDKMLAAPRIAQQMKDALKDANAVLDARDPESAKLAGKLDNAKNQIAPNTGGKTWAQVASENDAATKKAIADAQNQAKQQADLMELVKDASTEMTQVQVNNMGRILASGAPVAEQLKMIQTYINSLSNAKEINMAVTFGGNLDLMKMLGVGGATPGGRDLTKEMEETFGKQKSEIQAADVLAAGGDKNKAADTWAKNHMAELVAELLRDPKQFVNTGMYAAVQAAALAAPAGAAPTVAAGVIAGGLAGAAGAAGAGGAAATGPGAAAGASVLSGLQQSLSNANLAPDFLKSINAHSQDWENNGRKAATMMLAGFASEAEDEAGAIGSGFMRALINVFDGRYIRQPKVFGVAN